LPGLAEPSGQTDFDVFFYYSGTRLTRPTRVEIRINGGAPRVAPLQRPEDLKKSFSVSNAELRETTNTIEVCFAAGQVPTEDAVYLDRVVAHYRRRFEVIDAAFTFAGDPPTTAGWRHYALRGNLPERPLVLDVADPSRPRVIQHERDADGVLHFGQREEQTALYRVLSLDRIALRAS
jgi:hypothetical protein